MTGTNSSLSDGVKSGDLQRAMKLNVSLVLNLRQGIVLKGIEEPFFNAGNSR
jgi:hypothetical protein